MKEINVHGISLLSINFLFLLLLQSMLLYSADRNSNRNELDLADVENIRVSLYSLEPPDSLSLLNSKAEFFLFFDGRKDTLSKQSTRGTVTIRNDQLIFENEGRETQIDSLTITSVSTPTRLVTDLYGYRYYSGSLYIKENEHKTGLSIINSVDLETYIASVVGSEMDFEEPNALKAQAVVSRTYALWSVKRSPFREFDLRDHESNQVYVGDIPDKPHYRKAAEATSGEILTWSNKLILAVFSSTCGGSTANNMDVWDGIDHPYLRSQQDGEACSLSPHYNWTYSINKRNLQEMVEQYYGFEFRQKVIEKDPSGRVQKVILIDDSDDKITFTGNEFRLFINQFAGPLAIRSTKYEWMQDNDIIEFKGRGLGHGVGLCQWGSRGLAQAEWQYKDILTFYFSGTKIVTLDSIESNKIRLYN